MKISAFRILLVLLYVVAFSAILFLTYVGTDYYRLGYGVRPHDESHEMLKPGGLWGHGYGVVGSAMILLLFLYSLRKRQIFGIRFGSLPRWLDLHIWLGIIGPLLITLHTAGKFNGIVTISYASMVLVALSGFFGRYIYMQIPRDDRGHELSMREINTKIEGIGMLLLDDYHVPDSVLKLIDLQSGVISGQRLAGLSALRSLLVMDIMRPLRAYRLKRHIRKTFPDFPPTATTEIVRLARQKAVMSRRRAVLGSMHSLFHYWHVLHKPLAIVMIVIMFAHVVLVVLMGYKWIF